MAKHHSRAHPRVPHEIYVDTYFDLNRPLFKCDCCSIKLEVNQLVKHRRLAHRNKDNSFLKYKLPIIEYLHRNRVKAQTITDKLAPIIDLVSDISETEDGELASNEPMEPTSMDKTVQCEPESMEPMEPSTYETNACDDQHDKLDVADKYVGEHCEMDDKSTNTTNDDKQCQDAFTQTQMESPKSRLRPILPPLEIGVECDEDGFLELVLF